MMRWVCEGYDRYWIVYNREGDAPEVGCYFPAWVWELWSSVDPWYVESLD